jgi:hypothetical protein
MSPSTWKRLITMFEDVSHFESIMQAIRDAEPGSEVARLRKDWEGHGQPVRVNGQWRLEGFIDYFRYNLDLMCAVDPTLDPNLPPQCFDPASIAALFRIPVEELAPWLDESESEQPEDRQDSLIEQMKRDHSEILDSVRKISIAVQDLSENGKRSTQKEWYSPSEVAELLVKAPFTVREWCRLGRVNVRKRPTGRGDAKEWEISREEVERIRNHGLLPRPTKY